MRADQPSTLRVDHVGSLLHPEHLRGNLLTEEEQRRKLEVMLEVARQARS